MSLIVVSLLKDAGLFLKLSLSLDEKRDMIARKLALSVSSGIKFIDASNKVRSDTKAVVEFAQLYPCYRWKHQRITLSLLKARYFYFR